MLLRRDPMSMFSFSSCSDIDTLGTGLALTVCLDTFVFDWGSSEDETRRWGTGVPDWEEGFVEIGRENEETRAAGVGVPATEARGLRGGGPIEPSTALAKDFDADATKPFEVPFARTLLPRAGALDEVDNVSSDILRSFVALLISDMTEDGRETVVGVLKTVESRRVVRAGCEGVAPAVPRTPPRLFS